MLNRIRISCATVALLCCALTATTIYADHCDNDTLGNCVSGHIEDTEYSSHLAEKITELESKINKQGISSFFVVNIAGDYTGSHASYIIEKDIAKAITLSDFSWLSKTLHHYKLVPDLTNFTVNYLALHIYQPSSPERELAAAISRSDMPTVTQLLSGGNINLDKKIHVDGTQAVTPLHLAVVRENTEAIELLMNAGANINIGHDGSRVFPIHVPIARDNRALLVYLIERGANLDQPVWFTLAKHSILAHAVSQGDVELAKLLLAKGADPNRADVLGWTPLMDAIALDDERMIEILLPVSDLEIKSSLEITIGMPEKPDIGRYYPIGNALTIALLAPLKNKDIVVAAIKSRMPTSESGLGITVDELRVANALVADAINSNDSQTAANVFGDALARVHPESLAPDADREYVKLLDSMAVNKHELSLTLNTPVSEHERELIEKLSSISRRFVKWHNMLDVLEIAKTGNPKQALQNWENQHGIPSDTGWNFDILNDWIESQNDVTVRDRLYDTLDYFELGLGQ